MGLYIWSIKGLQKICSWQTELVECSYYFELVSKSVVRIFVKREMSYNVRNFFCFELSRICDAYFLIVHIDENINMYRVGSKMSKSRGRVIKSIFEKVCLEDAHQAETGSKLAEEYMEKKLILKKKLREALDIFLT